MCQALFWALFPEIVLQSSWLPHEVDTFYPQFTDREYETYLLIRLRNVQRPHSNKDPGFDLQPDSRTCTLYHCSMLPLQCSYMWKEYIYIYTLVPPYSGRTLSPTFLLTGWTSPPFPLEPYPTAATVAHSTFNLSGSIMPPWATVVAVLLSTSTQSKSGSYLSISLSLYWDLSSCILGLVEERHVCSEYSFKR